MSETRGLLLRLVWLRRLNQSLEWYEWDTKLTVDTDMTETPWPKLAQIWLRRPKKFCSRFSILHSYDCDTLQNNDQKFLGRLSHICASLGQGVSVISVSTVSFVSHSYHSKLWFKRLNHISLKSRPRVSLISVSIELVWRSHIRHPPILPTRVHQKPSIDRVHGPGPERSRVWTVKTGAIGMKGEHLVLSKCYMLHFKFIMGNAGIGTGVVTGCLY